MREASEVNLTKKKSRHFNVKKENFFKKIKKIHSNPFNPIQLT